MRAERRKGFWYSALFHFLLVVFSIAGLPSLLNPPPTEPMVITVELLPISEITNVKPQEATPEKKPEAKPEEKKQAKPSPPVKTAESAPPPPDAPAEKKKKETDKEKEKKPDKKKEEKKKPKEEDLAAVLKAVRETAEQEKQKKEAAAKADAEAKARADRYDPAMAMSLSEMDAIRSQIAKCWNVPAGAKDAFDLIIVLKVELNQDASLIKVELANESKERYGSDSFFRAAADSAMRAVRQCTPLQGLPPEKYAGWRALELRFDPKEMLF